MLGVVLFVGGVACAQGTNRYVRRNNPTPDPAREYLTWETAATNVNDAIDASIAGDTIFVTNGIYDTGGRAAGGLTNRVFINKAVSVRSVNGPLATAIKGAWDPANPHGFYGCGPAAVRCVYMTGGGELVGFTLTNGAAAWTGDANVGGGIRCAGLDDRISNCILISCSAYNAGGVRNGTLVGCVIRNNSARQYAGGALGSVLRDCVIADNYAQDVAGGTVNAELYNCEVKGNRNYAGDTGGAKNSTLYNSEVVGNRAGTIAGGVMGSSMYNCVVTGNSAGTDGGGVHGGSNWNCIVHGNTAGSSGLDYWGVSNFSFSLTSPLPAGPGNVDADPKFVVPGSGYGVNHVFGDYRLQRGSPCINSGTNFSWMAAGDPLGRDKDKDGGTRIYFGIVDMGAYEYVQPGTIFILRGQ